MLEGGPLPWIVDTSGYYEEGERDSLKFFSRGLFFVNFASSTGRQHYAFWIAQIHVWRTLSMESSKSINLFMQYYRC